MFNLLLHVYGYNMRDGICLHISILSLLLFFVYLIFIKAVLKTESGTHDSTNINPTFINNYRKQMKNKTIMSPISSTI